MKFLLLLFTLVSLSSCLIPETEEERIQREKKAADHQVGIFDDLAQFVGEELNL